MSKKENKIMLKKILENQLLIMAALKIEAPSNKPEKKSPVKAAPKKQTKK
ncbi:MAG: hypothetical protein ACJ76F_14240 [Bacteroidia bacterium]